MRQNFGAGVVIDDAPGGVVIDAKPPIDATPAEPVPGIGPDWRKPQD